MMQTQTFFHDMLRWLESTASSIAGNSGLLIYVVIPLLMLAGLVFSWWYERKRRDAFRRVAQRLGLTFSAARTTRTASRYAFINRLARGSNQYAFNSIQGIYRELTVHCFDYHYETYSTDSKGRRQTHHHYLSVYIAEHEAAFPELEIYPETFLHRLGQAVGMQDIDFESVDFSRAFVVRSPDRKFAYDVCHPRMMEYLLQHPELCLELEAQCIAICYDRRQTPAELQPHLDVLVEIRALLPAYLYSQ